MTDWEATRAAGLARLAEFLPRAGHHYARARNIDYGPEGRSNVSGLSPYLRRRMITEEEVVHAVLAQHNFAAAEKFIQEVAWRTYWKGWLELRPAMLDRFDTERIALKAELAANSRLSRRWQSAVEGRTGIDCFDAWVDELLTHGWLHNHARMWFASIWIFTLGLPWQLGADFFYKHLIDADPASNTLSWRWVAGLHTRGKHYVARAENIDRNTLGRFAPYGQLNEAAAAVAPDAEPPSPQSLPEPDGKNGGPVALLLTDAASRAAAHFGIPVTAVEPSGVAAWAQSLKAKTLVTGYAPTGLIARELVTIEHMLRTDGIALNRLMRDWDRALWPHATAGFFKLKTRLPEVISALV
jgi:deoxyribodipyrimidine photo-lyase